MKIEEFTQFTLLRKSRSSGRCLFPGNINRRYTRLRPPSSNTTLPAAATSFPCNKQLSKAHINIDDISTSLLSLSRLSNTRLRLTSFLRSFVRAISVPTFHRLGCSCSPVYRSSASSPHLGRKVTCTLFGHRKGHVTFAVQEDPHSEPVLIIELATSTAALVKELSSGQVRIALECEKAPSSSARGSLKLYTERVWVMYCNGRRYGNAVSRPCTNFDWYVLGVVRSVSVGGGVIPLVEDSHGGGGAEGELLFMRARFERVVGNRDSEAFYMINPDGNGGPELSVFLLRL